MPRQRPATVTHIDMHLARRDADRSVGPFTLADDLPPESLEVETPTHIRERREEVRRRKGERRAFLGYSAGCLALVVAGVILMHSNSGSAESIPNRNPVTVQQGENVTTAIERDYREEHDGQEADPGYVATQANLAVERQLRGSSLVHEGDTFYTEPQK